MTRLIKIQIVISVGCGRILTQLRFMLSINCNITMYYFF